ncbi:MAG: HAD family hydrolase [Ilumatobacteraceae bacterium]
MSGGESVAPPRSGVERFEVVAFDADDTLWHNEDRFVEVQARFVEIVAPHVSKGIDVADALHATEMANLADLGYGSEGLRAVDGRSARSIVTNGAVPMPVVRELIGLAREMLTEPVRLLDGVPEVLEQLSGDYRLVVVTKGDLVHQERKVTTSGLEHFFEYVEIVSEKDPPTYRTLIDLLGVEPARFCMIGNSVRSDVLPVLELGAHAVHIPYTYTWQHEHVEHDSGFAELGSIRELPDYLAACHVVTGSERHHQSNSSSSSMPYAASTSRPQCVTSADHSASTASSSGPSGHGSSASVRGPTRIALAERPLPACWCHAHTVATGDVSTAVISHTAGGVVRDEG